jgi:ribosomal protein L4
MSSHILTKEQQEYCLSVNPNFFKDLDTVRNQMIDEYIDFYNENQRQPKDHFSSREEKHCAQWRGAMKRAAKGLGNSIPLNDDQKARILAVDPLFFQDCVVNQRITEYISFYNENQRQPNYKSPTKEEGIARWRDDMKLATKGFGRKLPLTYGQKEQITAVDPGFFQEHIFDDRNQMIEKYICFYNENKRQPKKVLNEEYIACERLHETN